jgi:5'-methylthioadenosine phosphorylase
LLNFRTTAHARVVEKEVPDWPFGPTSSPVTIAKLPSGQALAFIARHGAAHSIEPSQVPVKANIAALKWLGVEAIVAFSAVGSLREEIRPRDVIIPNQIIDRTKVRFLRKLFGS